MAEKANFRPVSNVTFISKIVERVVAQQLHQYLTANDLLPHNQSAYRRQHSTETAMLRVMSDALAAADEQRVTLLGLLDLTAAFDCVDRGILLMRLQRQFGLSNTVLDWMTSFVTGRTQQEAYNGQLSPILPVSYGVPQGSVLGPLLFVLYTAELHDVVSKHGLILHQYADDCQVYVSTSTSDVHLTIDRFSSCMVDVNDWFSASRLRLNPSKTQVLWLGPKYGISRLTVREIPVVTASVQVSDSARVLGVMVDSQLSMADQVSSLCRSAYYQLRQLRPTVRAMTVDAAKTIVQAFISTRLDYCNSLLFGVADNLLQRLQSVQNAAARMITRTRRYEHITPVLRELHWLPVRQRVNFKLAVLVYKALHGQLPQYLCDDCQRVSDIGRRSSRSADVLTCSVPRTRTRLGDRSFAVAGPRLWNSLPSALWDDDISFPQFKRLLKTLGFE